MRPGLTVGQQAVMTAAVTPKMFAQFDGKIVHPAYSTVAMVYHMEWAARKLILPFLEEEEEGMGGAVAVQHLGVSGEGEMITVTAEITEIKGRRIVAHVVVKNSRGLIGRGEVTQFVLSKTELKEKLK